MPQEIIPATNIGIIILVSVILAQIAQHAIFANHGEEIDIKFSDAQFFLVPSKNIQQIKFTTTYTVSDSGIINKQISASMKIYTENGTLIKTTSIPNGFKADKTGFQQFVTSLPANSINEINAVVSFTELNITSPLSNSLEKKLALNQTQTQ